LIAIFKKEKDHRLEDGHVKLSIVQNYSLIWSILKLPGIQLLAITMLTAKVNIVYRYPGNPNVITLTEKKLKKYFIRVASIIN